MTQGIGVIIRRLRKELKISQETLGRGIVSKSELSRIEHEEKEPDCFLLCALMQRLGKSISSFELVVSGAEYRLLCLRESIQQSMLAADRKETECWLKKYEKCIGSSKPIHRQYMLMVQAVKQFLEKGDCAESLDLLKRAAGLSGSDLSELEEVKSCLYSQELQILFLEVFLLIEQEEYAEAVSILERIRNCVEIWHPAKEIKEEMYPKYSYLMAKVYLRMRDMEQALTMVEAVQPLYEGEENEQFTGEILDFIVMGQRQKVIPENELLKKKRIAKGWSQEVLSEGICARETVSKIENGRAPNQKTIKKLMEKLGIDRKKYSGAIPLEKL